MNEQERRAAFLRGMLPYAQGWAASLGYGGNAKVIQDLLGWISSESNYGNAASVFGVKGSGTAGSETYATHEVLPDGSTIYINDQFAKFNNPDEAFQHMVNLVSGQASADAAARYGPAWAKLQSGDWEGFLAGINAAGYATDPNWHSMIQTLGADVPSYGVDPAGAADPNAPAVQPAPGIGGSGTAQSSLYAKTDEEVQALIESARGKPAFKAWVISQYPETASVLASLPDTADFDMVAVALATAGMTELVTNPLGLPYADAEYSLNGLYKNTDFPSGITEADLGRMVSTGELTKDQALRIFDEAMAVNYDETKADLKRAEIQSIEVKGPDDPAGLTDAQWRDAVKEGRQSIQAYEAEMRTRHAEDWNEDRFAEELRLTQESRQAFMDAEAKKNAPTPIGSDFDPYGVSGQFADQVNPFMGTDVQRDALVQSGDMGAIMAAFEQANPDIPFSANLISPFLGSSWSPNADPDRAQNMDVYQSTGGDYLYQDYARDAASNSSAAQAQSLYDITRTNPVLPAGDVSAISAPPPAPVLPEPRMSAGLDMNAVAQPAPAPAPLTPEQINLINQGLLDPATIQNEPFPFDMNAPAVQITGPSFAGSDGGLLDGARPDVPAFSQLPDGTWVDANGQIIGNSFPEQPYVFNESERNLYNASPGLFTGDPSYTGQVNGEQVGQFSGVRFDPSNPNQGQRIADALGTGDGLQGASEQLQERDRIALAKTSQLANQQAAPGYGDPEAYAARLASAQEQASSQGVGLTSSIRGFQFTDGNGEYLPIGPEQGYATAEEAWAAYSRWLLRQQEIKNDARNNFDQPPMQMSAAQNRSINNFGMEPFGGNPNQPSSNPPSWNPPTYNPPPPPVTPPAPPVVEPEPLPRPTFTPRTEELLAAMGV